MATYSVSLDVSAAWAEPDVCPLCATVSLVRTPGGAGTDYDCEGCGSRWSVRAGRLARTGGVHRHGEHPEGVALPRQAQR